jgi:RNA-directed DNA polymerase
VAAGFVVAKKRGNARGAKEPCCSQTFNDKEGRGEMIKAPIKLQDLRRRIYAKAKAEPSWRFWGLYVHVCKEETLRAAYAMARKNNGAPGVDGVTFQDIEAQGVEDFLTQIRDDLSRRTYRPQRVRRVEIPKVGGKTRRLSIPTIRDRVVQGALKLVLEPVFEADFQEGSFGYRPERSPKQALQRVSEAIFLRKTRVIDMDLQAYFDSVRHDVLLKKVSKRVDDDDVMHLLKMILKASGKRGVPQGGVISPLLSNLYLDQVDRMLERAKEVTRYGQWDAVEYARFADDLVILVDYHPRHRWLQAAVQTRLREEFGRLGVAVNEQKSRVVDLAKGESFGFLGFDIRLACTRAGKPMPLQTPQIKKRTALIRELKRLPKSPIPTCGTSD